jgi:hypothetical protein
LTIEQPGFAPLAVLVTVAPFAVLPVTFPVCHVGPALIKRPLVMLRQAMVILLLVA